MKTLPPGVALRFVSWDAEGIRDVAEFTSRLQFRESARTFLRDEKATAGRMFEVATEDEALRFNATLVSGVPMKCRTEQPALTVGGELVALDRFWDMLCDSMAEIVSELLIKRAGDVLPDASWPPEYRDRLAWLSTR